MSDIFWGVSVFFFVMVMVVVVVGEVNRGPTHPTLVCGRLSRNSPPIEETLFMTSRGFMVITAKLMLRGT